MAALLHVLAIYLLCRPHVCSRCMFSQICCVIPILFVFGELRENLPFANKTHCCCEKAMVSLKEPPKHLSLSLEPLEAATNN